MAKGPKARPHSTRKVRINAENKTIESQLASIEKFREASQAELAALAKFEDLPLSKPSLAGLKSAHYTDLTAIQRECILPVLQKQDVLAAARTGSGKTLGFLVPLLERLYLERWTQMDGLGALVITPTRELALQIFEVLRKIGCKHTFSAGLLIGGKNVQAEKERVSKLNVLIATPGRLLQHMDESPGFDANNLQLLVLDEADRLMDMGFKKTIDAIVENLPPQRQTLLFSATQTKTVSDLARLSLNRPRYISIVDLENPGATAGSSTTAETNSGKIPTPKGLDQFYTVVPLEDKLNMLWSFLRTHTKNKVLVFFASSKQVRFVFESFKRMQPGIPLMHLHGRQKQTSRMETTNKFMRSRASCLLATDVVARGLDFPEVDWVIQVDCPEDVSTYIHRVGRSARNGKTGKALLMLSSHEKPAFVANLEARKIPISEISVNSTKRSSIQAELQAQLFQDPELKYLAQKSFISYMRSVHIQQDKQVFDVTKIPLEEFAKSLGLVSAPNVKIKGNLSASKEVKNRSRALLDKPSASAGHEEVRTKFDRIFQRQNQNVLSEHYQKLVPQTGSDDEDDGFMSVKRQNHDLSDDGSEDEGENHSSAKDGALSNEAISKRALKKSLSKKQSLLATAKSPAKLVFDDEGQAHPLYEFDTEADFRAKGLPEDQRQQFVAGEREEMEVRDTTDKEVLKQRRQEKKRRRQELERLAREGADSEEEVVARLPSDNEFSEPEEQYDYGNPSNDNASESESEPEVDFRRPAKKQKHKHHADVLEVDEPETLQDLEALSRKLLGH